jgi:hypothetical protein
VHSHRIGASQVTLYLLGGSNSSFFLRLQNPKNWDASQVTRNNSFPSPVISSKRGLKEDTAYRI